MRCPRCNTDAAYQGASPASDVECLNKDCDLYSEVHDRAVNGPPPPPVPPPQLKRPSYTYASTTPPSELVTHRPTGKTINVSLLSIREFRAMLTENIKDDGSCSVELMQALFCVLQKLSSGQGLTLADLIDSLHADWTGKP